MMRNVVIFQTPSTRRRIGGSSLLRSAERYPNSDAPSDHPVAAALPPRLKDHKLSIERRVVAAYVNEVIMGRGVAPAPRGVPVFASDVAFIEKSPVLQVRAGL